jgi:hypothetical protein
MGVCYLCGRLEADVVDHLVELAAGGTNDLTNLASCHAACHRRKHADPAWAAERVESALRVLGDWARTPTSAFSLQGRGVVARGGACGSGS